MYDSLVSRNNSKNHLTDNDVTFELFLLRLIDREMRGRYWLPINCVREGNFAKSHLFSDLEELSVGQPHPFGTEDHPSNLGGHVNK
ncbi:11383_t:CDS:2 [Acaulospora colombiana]|uniref:11383_t:CDS:1 n=1 Tax=Acaulospora colombiana TaxID=27376 RepID=A0ACA9KAL9_9GLOM|nr:11383_t:CDS:2 [Acaulospora colombiana]